MDAALAESIIALSALGGLLSDHRGSLPEREDVHTLTDDFTAMDTKESLALMAAAVTLFGLLAAHRLHFWRDKQKWKADATSAFRMTLSASVSQIPASSEHWGNDVLEKMPSVLREIRVAVDQFAPTLAPRTASSFNKDFAKLRELVEVKLPKSLSSAEILYGGGQYVAKATKVEVHRCIEALRKYAK
ncbi:MAG: hypothetical protein EON58_10715 [Alphaproteobacteria bacterium]|nr:MAG: hypothetical protein EON58_10715 [Alphaproteobacteria bacterium]